MEYVEKSSIINDVGTVASEHDATNHVVLGTIKNNLGFEILKESYLSNYSKTMVVGYIKTNKYIKINHEAVNAVIMYQSTTTPLTKYKSCIGYYQGELFIPLSFNNYKKRKVFNKQAIEQDIEDLFKLHEYNTTYLDKSVEINPKETYGDVVFNMKLTATELVLFHKFCNMHDKVDMFAFNYFLCNLIQQKSHIKEMHEKLKYVVTNNMRIFNEIKASEELKKDLELSAHSFEDSDTRKSVVLSLDEAINGENLF